MNPKMTIHPLRLEVEWPISSGDRIFSVSCL